MHSLLWAALCCVVVICWGVLGVFEKLASDHLPPAAALLWVAIGFILLQTSIAFPLDFSRYQTSGLIWALGNGVLTAVGFLALLSAMRHGGKASVVEPLSALYPVLVALVAPSLFGERLSLRHGLGVACAFGAVLLFTANKSEDTQQTHYV